MSSHGGCSGGHSSSGGHSCSGGYSSSGGHSSSSSSPSFSVPSVTVSRYSKSTGQPDSGVPSYKIFMRLQVLMMGVFLLLMFYPPAGGLANNLLRTFVHNQSSPE